MNAMPFRPNEAELDTFIGVVLDAYKEGRAGRSTVVQLLRHAMLAAASDSEAEFKAYVQLSQDKLRP
jgi:hypothetical protein